MSSKGGLPEGAVTDLVTPFSKGDIDRIGLMTLIEWQIRGGISGLVICGEAGEASTLSREERSALVKLAVDVADHQVPVLAGTGTNATESTIALTAEAKTLGADAAAIVTPYYSKPSQEGLYRHFEAVALAVDIPIIICSAPARTAIDLSPATLERLVALPAVVGMVDCTGDIGRRALMPVPVRDRLRCYSGADRTGCAFNLMGGQGSFSLAANVAPRLFSAMYHAVRTGNVEAAIALQARVDPLIAALEAEHSIAATKMALSLVLGLSPEVRLPLRQVAPETTAAIRKALSPLPGGETAEHRRAG